MCQKRITCLHNTLVFILGLFAGMLAKTGSTFLTPENIIMMIVAGLVFYFTHKYSEPTLNSLKQLLTIF